MFLLFSGPSFASPWIVHVADAGGQVVVGASVSSGDRVVVTDARGVAAIDGEVPLRVEVSLDGFWTGSWSVTVPDGEEVWLTLLRGAGREDRTDFRTRPGDSPRVDLSGGPCHSNADCADREGLWTCRSDAPGPTCGDRTYDWTGAVPPECAHGTRPNPCGVPQLSCYPRCRGEAAEACRDDEWCGEDGWCAPRRCPETLTCAAHEVCHPAGWCAGAPCGPDAPCAAGTCVQGRCAAELGQCRRFGS